MGFSLGPRINWWVFAFQRNFPWITVFRRDERSDKTWEWRALRGGKEPVK